MKTTKPIATISYNSLTFLTGTLEKLKTNGLIQFWALIHHQAEEDEKKDHYHVFIEPAKPVDTLWIRQQFNEMKSGEKDPVGCLPLRSSKWVDWYWYSIHDVGYLLSKGETRQYHYTINHVVTSERDYLEELVRTNPCPANEMVRVADLLKEGLTAIQIACVMNIAVKNLNYFVAGVQAIQREIDGGSALTPVYRGNHGGHEVIDMQGENEDEKH